MFKYSWVWRLQTNQISKFIWLFNFSLLLVDFVTLAYNYFIKAFETQQHWNYKLFFRVFLACMYVLKCESFQILIEESTTSLRESCLNTKFFLVRIFPHLDWIRRDTPYLSVFSPNAGKYGPEKTLYLDTFQVALDWPNVYQLDEKK